MLRPPPTSTLFPYTTLFRSYHRPDRQSHRRHAPVVQGRGRRRDGHHAQDRKSTRLNSSHITISYAVFCLKKKKQKKNLINASCNSDIDFTLPFASVSSRFSI